MADARTEILGRIRTARAAATSPEPGHRTGAGPPTVIPRYYARTRDIADVVGLAAERIADYRAIVHRVPAPDLPAAITAALTRRGARLLVGPTTLPADWQVPGVDWQLDDPALTTGQLDAADGVLTGCAVTIAETGTIILDAGPRQGRRALTLLPDYHLCVVHTNQIVGTVPEAVAALTADRPLTLISGPSATSDIELDRVEGVHGPRTLEVLITD